MKALLGDLKFHYEPGFRVGFVDCSVHGKIAEIEPHRIPRRGEPTFSRFEIEAAMHCDQCEAQQKVIPELQEQLKKKSRHVLRRRFLQ